MRVFCALCASRSAAYSNLQDGEQVKATERVIDTAGSLIYSRRRLYEREKSADRAALEEKLYAGHVSGDAGLYGGVEHHCSAQEVRLRGRRFDPGQGRADH